ncbi:MAG: flagellar motor switch protein FliM [Armatimonadota bacterium]
MSDILSQAEIEALLSSLSPADAGLPSDVTAPPTQGQATQKTSRSAGRASTLAYEVYDFRRPDKFSKDQLRTLQMLHETFARLAGTALSGYLRTNVAIELISLEQVPYEEYMRSISNSVFTITSISPLVGQAALEVEFALVFTMLDKLLGGPGRVVNRNVLTDIETPLYRQIIDRMFTALKAAWEGVVVVNPMIEAIENNAQFVQIAPPTDIVVSILFEVRVGESHGAMSLCIPYVLLKPVTNKLSAQKWFVANSARKQTRGHREALVQQLHETEVEAAVQLGRTKLSFQDVLRLRAGDVIRLDQKTDKDLTLLVSRQPKYAVKAGLDGSKIAFEVTRPIQQR